jgi:hypothetical protein
VIVLVVMIIFQREHALGAMHRHYVPNPEVKKVLFESFPMNMRNLHFAAIICYDSWLPYRHLLYKVQYPRFLLQSLSCLITKVAESVLRSYRIYDMFLHNSNVSGRLLVWLEAFTKLGSG